MDPPRRGLARPFSLATGATADRRGPHISLGDFVPPSLLRGGPEFGLSAILTTEGPILIIAPPNEIRNAVAGRSPQPGGRDSNGSEGPIHRTGLNLARLALGSL